MVKVLNPFCSVSVHGRVGNVVYQSGPFGPFVRGLTPQRGKPSDKQRLQNYLFGSVADEWRLLSDEVKEEYHKRAVPLKLTGFNLYIKENIKHPINLYGSALYGSGRYK